ncbi:RNA-guided endonuclease TnpB family protein [Acidianus sulfidivorans]|uniref:RNA-guided endonuclease TnpB family protein n=1 Tax=Acidianus sulfidivorans TaxID=312539 RepID=UPI0030B85AC7
MRHFSIDTYMLRGFVLGWLYENKTIKKKDVHQALYKKLREKFELKARLAEDCYRDAISTYKGWLKNPKRGRFPVIRNKSIWLSPKLSYNFNMEKMRLTILGEEVKILGYPRTLETYKDWEIAEARLTKRREDYYLNVTMKKELEEVIPNGLIAVDVNMDGIYLGNDKQVIIIPTYLSDAHHYKNLAEKLQKKYPRRWKENKRILNRIRHFHTKARNILLDFAKKVGKWVTDEAKRLNANVIVLENLNKMINHVSNLSKDYRGKLYLMQYRRVQEWIQHQAVKHNMKVIFVDAKYSSTTCPKCGSRMEESGYRTLKCEKCGFEENRDYVAVYNLYGRGSLSLSTAPQRRDVNTNR